MSSEIDYEQFEPLQFGGALPPQRPSLIRRR